MTITGAYPNATPVTFAPGPCSNYQWVAAGPNPCPRCAGLDGQVRSLQTWNMSVNPGFHQHCHCYLKAVDFPASGMAFADQFSYIAISDLFNAISAIFRLPAPDEQDRKKHQDAEGAEDVAVYDDTHKTDRKNYPGGERPT